MISFIPRCFCLGRVKIPVIRLQGVITSQFSPLRNTFSLADCASILEKAFFLKKAPAVALLINSPGGSPVQSRFIFQRIRDLAEDNQKTVFAFIEDVAASGGYMIACAADEIYADPSSIVGSIGVVSASFGFPELLKKIGIERRVYTAGKNKVSLDPFQPEKSEDIAHLKFLQSQIHETFIQLVKKRREKALNEKEDLFSGLFWTGIRGKELGLVDGLGDISSVLKKRYGKEVRLRLISNSRGILGYKSMGGIFYKLNKKSIFNAETNLAADAISSCVSLAEEHALRARYGL